MVCAGPSVGTPIRLAMKSLCRVARTLEPSLHHVKPLSGAGKAGLFVTDIRC